MSYVVVSQMSLLLFCAVLVLAAFEDVADYRIPNSLVIASLALYPLFYLTAETQPSLWMSLVMAVVFFLVGTALFAAGILGGGDVKLIAVTALWVGPSGLVYFVLGMTLCGGLMGLFMMSPMRIGSAYVCGQIGFYSAHEKLMKNELPYGVAICVGGLAGLAPMMGLL